MHPGMITMQAQKKYHPGMRFHGKVFKEDENEI